MKFSTSILGVNTPIFGNIHLNSLDQPKHTERNLKKKSGPHEILLEISLNVLMKPTKWGIIPDTNKKFFHFSFDPNPGSMVELRIADIFLHWRRKTRKWHSGTKQTKRTKLRKLHEMNEMRNESMKLTKWYEMNEMPPWYSVHVIFNMDEPLGQSKLNCQHPQVVTCHQAASAAFASLVWACKAPKAEIHHWIVQQPPGSLGLDAMGTIRCLLAWRRFMGNAPWFSIVNCNVPSNFLKASSPFISLCICEGRQELCHRIVQAHPSLLH